MLWMREEQMEAFRQAQFERLDAELVRYASARFPMEATRLGPVALKAKVTTIRVRCQTCGFQSTEAFALGIDFTCLHGDDWFDARWARRITQTSLLPETLRLEVLKKAEREEPR